MLSCAVLMARMVPGPEICWGEPFELNRSSEPSVARTAVSTGVWTGMTQRKLVLPTAESSEALMVTL